MLEVMDYFVLVITLCIPTSIGLYFGCSGTKQKTATEYLYGKGKLKAIPMGISIFSSAISAIAIVGAPSEIYLFGAQFVMIYVGALLSFILTWIFVLPVFCGELKITTPYEYFELRFNYRIRIMSTLMYILHTLFFMPIVLYASTANLSEITQVPLPICTMIIGGICIFYTVLGGFSAVIWSDTLQASFMLGSCIFVMIKGIIDNGGMSEVFYKADQGERTNFFITDPNPFLRLTLWSAVIGMTFNHGAHSGFSASSIQRYMALKTEKQARISVVIGSTVTFITGLIVCMIGLNMFAKYYGCDPVSNKDVSSYNKLISYYVADTVREIPGFLGFFNAGIISAGLSTLSAELNTVSGLMYHCIIKRICRKPFSESNGAIIMKIVVLVNGLYYLLVAPYMDRSKHLQSLALAVGGITYGAKLGMMILGTAFPKCNSIGAAVGAIAGMIIMGWISLGAIFYDVNSQYVKPFSTDRCMNNNFTEIYATTTTTITHIINVSREEPFFIYKLSYMYYVLLGTVITICFALVVSCLTGNNDETKIDPNLLIPRVRKAVKNNYAETTKMLNLKI